MRKTLLYILLLLLPAVSLRAQEEDTYLMEVGAGGGMMGYLGDFNSTITKDLQPMASLLWRYNLSPYMGEGQCQLRQDEGFVGGREGLLSQPCRKASL